jgi:hypothetical protein
LTFTSTYNHLNVPDQWNDYFSKYPNGYTILEAVINWAGQVNDMTDTLNSTTDYVKDFMTTFDTDLSQTTKDTLTQWQSDGTLDTIITQALQTDLGDITTLTTTDKTSAVKAINEVNAQLADIQKHWTLFTANGGKVNDSSFDNTSALNSLISTLASNGGGVIWFEDGTYTFKGTIVLKRGVTLLGHWGTEPWRYNITGVIFNHAPTMAGTDFITMDSPDSWGYLWNPSIRNMTLQGSANSAIGLKAYNVGKGYFENLLVKDFDRNIVNSYSMTTDYVRVASTGGRTSCWHVTGTVSTSTNFRSCYSGQTIGNLTSRPLIIDNNMALDLNFYSFLIESTEVGADLGSGNQVNFYAVYVENVPNTPADIAIFSIGKHGDASTSNDRGDTAFFGGIIAGTNSANGPTSGSKIFDVDYVNSLVVNGTKLERANTAIATTANTRNASFINSTDVQVMNSVDTDTSGRVTRLGNVSGTHNNKPTDGFRPFKLQGTSGNFLFDINTGYTLTDMHIRSSLAARDSMVFDGNGNVHLFGQVPNSNITGGGVLALIESAPTVSGAFAASGLFTKTVDTAQVPYAMRSDKRQAPIQTTFADVTGNRPISGRFPGMMYFDTTLGKPIWWNGSVWKDSTGATV